MVNVSLALTGGMTKRLNLGLSLFLGCELVLNSIGIRSEGRFSTIDHEAIVGRLQPSEKYLLAIFKRNLTENKK